MDGYKWVRDKEHGIEEMVPFWYQDAYEAPEEIRDVLCKEELEEIKRVEDSVGVSSYYTLIEEENQISYEIGDSIQESTTVAQTDAKTNEDTDQKNNEKTTVVTNEVYDSNTEGSKLTKRRKYQKKWYNEPSIFSVELLSKNYFSEKSVGKHYSLPKDLVAVNYTLWKKIKDLYNKVELSQRKDTKILTILRICLDVPRKIYSHYLTYFRKKDQSPRYFYETYSVAYALGFVEIFEAEIGPWDTIKLFCEFLYLSQKQKQGRMMKKVKSSIQSADDDCVKSNEVLHFISKVKPLEYDNRKCGLCKLVEKIPSLAIILSKILKEPRLTGKLLEEEKDFLSKLSLSGKPDSSPSPTP